MATSNGHHDSSPIMMADVTRAWWPLALSWMMMALEIPTLGAVIARLADPQINLAAFGGIVFPLALVIESPIIMMLAASTALCQDWSSYLRLYRFMWRLSMTLTILHGLVAFTPLYDVLIVGILSPPAEIIEPGRLGLQLMLPWTWAIADRRFHQGVLIRFGKSRLVGAGTVIRLIATCSTLAIGYAIDVMPGIAVATLGLSVGVIVEAVYARIAVAPVLRMLREDAATANDAAPMSLQTLLVFYVPLALTPLLQLLAQPIGSATISRMPQPLISLAAWPALNGLIFLSKSVGMAYNEVVVSYCERPGAVRPLWRFTVVLSVMTMLVLLLLAATPLGRIWFSTVCGLDAELTAMASAALWLALLLPGLTVLQSLYQGILVSTRRTRGIPESMVLFIVVAAAVLGLGVWLDRYSGLFVALAAFTLGHLAQTGWLLYRCRFFLRHGSPEIIDVEIGRAAAPEFGE